MVVDDKQLIQALDAAIAVVVDIHLLEVAEQDRHAARCSVGHGSTADDAIAEEGIILHLSFAIPISFPGRSCVSYAQGGDDAAFSMI